jgi:hypothetical protein
MKWYVALYNKLISFINFINEETLSICLCSLSKMSFRNLLILNCKFCVYNTKYYTEFDI